MPSIEEQNVYGQAAKLIIDSQNPSVAYLQRQLRLGYGAACELMSRLEEDGIVTPADEQGFRRLTPKYETTDTQVFNEWRVFPNAEDAPLEGALIDVSAGVAAARPFSPSQISFYRENGLPFIELEFASVIAPVTVIHLGLELQHALGLPVYMANLQSRKIEYIVEGNFLLSEGDDYASDPFVSLRLPIAELAHAWDIAIPSMAR